MTFSINSTPTNKDVIWIESSIKITLWMHLHERDTLLLMLELKSFMEPMYLPLQIAVLNVIHSMKRNKSSKNFFLILFEMWSD